MDSLLAKEATFKNLRGIRGNMLGDFSIFFLKNSVEKNMSFSNIAQGNWSVKALSGIKEGLEFDKDHPVTLIEMLSF